jgi:cytoskeletal protein RodZ
MSEPLEELKDKAENLLDRNKDGKIDKADFDALQKNQKIVVVAVAAMLILITLNVLGSIFGAFKSDEPRKSPVKVEKPADVPEVPEAPKASVIELSDGTIQALADAVAARVSSKQPQAQELEKRTLTLEQDIERLTQAVNNHDVHLQQLQKEVDNKRKRFLGVF